MSQVYNVVYEHKYSASTYLCTPKAKTESKAVQRADKEMLKRFDRNHGYELAMVFVDTVINAMTAPLFTKKELINA